MTRTLVRDFHNWDYSEPRAIECERHPENKYYWKGPGRNIHMVSAGVVKECSCAISECTVLTDGEQWTTTIKQDIGTYCLQNSGPSWEYSIKEYGYAVAVFTVLEDAIFFVNSRREQSGRDVSLEPLNWTDGWTIEAV